MPKPSEQAQIDFIVDCLRKGQERKDILQKFTKTYKVSTKTFDTRLKLATKQVQAEQQRIRGEAEQDIAKEVNALKSKIWTSFERKEYLTKVMKGEVKIKQPFVVGGKIMEYPAEPSMIDRLKAVAELNKMEGDYAPTKQDLNITANKPIIIDWTIDADNKSDS